MIQPFSVYKVPVRVVAVNPGGVEVIVPVRAAEIPLEVGLPTPAEPGAVKPSVVELGAAKPGSVKPDAVELGGAKPEPAGRIDGLL